MEQGAGQQRPYTKLGNQPGRDRWERTEPDLSCTGAAGLRPTCLRVLSPPARSQPALTLKRLVFDAGREMLPAMVDEVGQMMVLSVVARVMVAVMARVRGGRGQLGMVDYRG